MKILQVCPRYYPDIGGLEEHVRSISEILSKDNDVTVATTDPSGKLCGEETIKSVHVFRFKSWAPSQSYFFSGGLRDFLRKNAENYDILHAHSYSTFPALYAAQTKGVKRFVFTSHYHGAGHTFLRNVLHRPYKLLGQAIFKNADRIISVSKYEKSLIMNDFPINPNKIVLIPNGINKEEFKGIVKQRTEQQALLYVGRLEKYKGIHYLIEVLPLLDQKVTLRIVGSGPYKEQLVEHAKHCNVLGRVHFLNNISRKELLQEYANAALFASLSLHEAYGLTVAEALMSGVPCVVANVSGLTEWVDNDRCFGLTPPINLNELSCKIKENIGKQISKPDLLSWEDVAKKIEETYYSLLPSDQMKQQTSNNPDQGMLD